VRICSLYGAGFFYIPGTDTCIKLGGYLRADLTINGGIYDGPFWNGEGAIRDRYANFYNDRSRLALTIDTRTATEYGVVRTFGQADFQFSSFGSTSSIGVAASVNPGATQGQVNNDTAGNGYVAVEFAFVQFAGFTFGKSASAYATPWHGYPGNNTSFLTGTYDSVTGINNIQYTWQFGNGVSATLGIDESGAQAFNRTQIINAVGTGQLGNTVLGASGGNIGFSGAASSFITGVGTAYGGNSSPDPSSFDIYKGTRFAMGVVTDSIYSGTSVSNGNVATQLQLTRGWGFQGAFNHNWDPYWSTSLFGGIAGLSYNQTAKQLYCNTYVANAGIAVRGGGVTSVGGTGGVFGAGSICDPGFTISEIGLVTRWTPVKN